MIHGEAVCEFVADEVSEQLPGKEDRPPAEVHAVACAAVFLRKAAEPGACVCDAHAFQSVPEFFRESVGKDISGQQPACEPAEVAAQQPRTVSLH